MFSWGVGWGGGCMKTFCHAIAASNLHVPGAGGGGLSRYEPGPAFHKGFQTKYAFPETDRNSHFKVLRRMVLLTKVMGELPRYEPGSFKNGFLIKYDIPATDHPHT